MPSWTDPPSYPIRRVSRFAELWKQQSEELSQAIAQEADTAKGSQLSIDLGHNESKIFPSSAKIRTQNSHAPIEKVMDTNLQAVEKPEVNVREREMRENFPQPGDQNDAPVAAIVAQPRNQIATPQRGRAPPLNFWPQELYDYLLRNTPLWIQNSRAQPWGKMDEIIARAKENANGHFNMVLRSFDEISHKMALEIEVSIYMWYREDCQLWLTRDYAMRIQNGENQNLIRGVEWEKSMVAFYWRQSMREFERLMDEYLGNRWDPPVVNAENP